jgi:hypothetical protein
MRRMTSDPQQVTISVGVKTLTTLLGSTSFNGEYTCQEFYSDLTKMIFKEADTREKVTKYRANIQSEFVNHLISQYKTLAVTSVKRPYILFALKQLKTKTGNAMNSSNDTFTKAHFTNLNDAITRALSINA